MIMLFSILQFIHGKMLNWNFNCKILTVANQTVEESLSSSYVCKSDWLRQCVTSHEPHRTSLVSTIQSTWRIAQCIAESGAQPAVCHYPTWVPTQSESAMRLTCADLWHFEVGFQWLPKVSTRTLQRCCDNDHLCLRLKLCWDIV